MDAAQITAQVAALAEAARADDADAMAAAALPLLGQALVDLHRIADALEDIRYHIADALAALGGAN